MQPSDAPDAQPVAQPQSEQRQHHVRLDLPREQDVDPRRWLRRHSMRRPRPSANASPTSDRTPVAASTITDLTPYYVEAPAQNPAKGTPPDLARFSDALDPPTRRPVGGPGSHWRQHPGVPGGVRFGHPGPATPEPARPAWPARHLPAGARHRAGAGHGQPLPDHARHSDGRLLHRRRAADLHHAPFPA